MMIDPTSRASAPVLRKRPPPLAPATSPETSVSISVTRAPEMATSPPPPAVAALSSRRLSAIVSAPVVLIPPPPPEVAELV